MVKMVLEIKENKTTLLKKENGVAIDTTVSMNVTSEKPTKAEGEVLHILEKRLMLDKPLQFEGEPKSDELKKLKELLELLT